MNGYPDPRTPSQRDFDQAFSRAGKAFGAWFVFCALLGLAVLGVVVWAVVRLVLHFT